MPDNSQPFGLSPYNHLQPLIAKLERAVGMDWTNNIWSATPQTTKEADQAWDEAGAMVIEIASLAEELERSVTKRHREVLELIDQADAEAEAS